jgi:hypothetical protein
MNEFIPESAKKLRPGQKALCKLFSDSLKNSKVVTREDLFAVYKEHVAIGQSQRFRADSKDYANNQWVWVPWQDWEWDRNFERWFVNSIGSMVIRGYLKTIPTIDLSKPPVDPKS